MVTGRPSSSSVAFHRDRPPVSNQGPQVPLMRSPTLIRSSSRNRPPSRATAWDGDPKISATVTEYLLPLPARRTSSSRAPFAAGDPPSSLVSPRAAPAAEGSTCGNEPPKNPEISSFRPGGRRHQPVHDPDTGLKS